MNFANKLADAGAACVGTKMRGDIFLLFKPRELQFATSQSGNRNSVLMEAWWAYSALGQG